MWDELKRRNVVRVAIAYLAAAWLIVQIVETLFPVFDLSNASIRMVVIVLAIGFPAAIVFSWFYEIGPGGVTREQDADHDSQAGRIRTKRFDKVIVTVLALAVGYFAVDKFVLDPARDAERQEQIAEQAKERALTEIRSGNRLAVLPFVNRSRNPDDEYLSDGFSDDLIHLLSREQRFVVISSRSSFAFKDTSVTIPEIAAQLDASYVVEGHMQVAGDEIRITAALVDTASDTSMWTQDYRLTMSSWDDTQRQVADAIVDSLKTRLSLSGDPVTSRIATDDEDAHKAYLLGRHLVAQRRPDLLPAAIERFREAVRLDPMFALGFAELSMALWEQGCDDQLGIDCEAESYDHAVHALELDPELPEAQLAMSMQFRSSQPESALRFAQKAIELNPGYADAHARLAEIYLRMPFRVQDRIDALERALRFDPLSRRANDGYIFSLLERSLVEEAKAHIESYSLIDPNRAAVMRGHVEALDGNNAEFVFAMLKASSGGLDSIAFGRTLNEDFNWQLVSIGLAEEAASRSENVELIAWFKDLDEGVRLVRENLNANPDSFIAKMQAGFVLAHAGLYDEARPHLEKAWETMSGVPRNDFNTAFIIEALYTIRLADGDETGAADILAKANDGIRRFHDAGITSTHNLYYSTDYLEGIVRYLEGDHDEAIPLLLKVADSGFDIPPPSPFQMGRFEDPRYAEVIERERSREARERQKVLQLVCAEGFKHPVWEPMPATCEKFGTP